MASWMNDMSFARSRQRCARSGLSVEKRELGIAKGARWVQTREENHGVRLKMMDDFELCKRSELF
jgi:hypothetical protein